MVYDRLKCQSPQVVARVLEDGLRQAETGMNSLRVLDLGAGNGMVGEELKSQGVSRLVGVDIIPEAREATERDRPAVYDAYYVMDFLDLSDEQVEELRGWSLDCLVCVAALGFGDIPARAFLTALDLIAPQGWLAFNIKESFLSPRDDSGFSELVRALLFSDYFQLSQLRRYRHRFSLEGEPLYYYAVCGRKTSDVPADFADELQAR